MKNSGFTLVEMSIVLVIIGLIVGGVLAGQDLIKIARIQKTSAELNSMATAIRTFKLKYSCLPGDCSMATNFFSAGAGCPNSTGPTGTCNGDGDGYVAPWNGAGNVEDEYLYQHLAMAGMISGSYPNATGGSSDNTIMVLSVGSNIWASSYNSNIGYEVYSFSSAMTVGNWPTVFNGALTVGDLIIQIGEVSPSTWKDMLWGAGFTAPDAYLLDRKFDDGNPSSGIIMGFNSANAGIDNTNTTCLSGTQYSASYNTGCTLIYRKAY